MRIDLMNGRRVIQHSLVIATTLATCAALQANEHEDKQHTGVEHSEKHGSMSADKFIQKAMAGGRMEVQMGQLAQQRAQNQQVKSLGETLVRDHQQANQRLQQLASSKGVSATQAGQQDNKQAKHQQQLDKLRSQSGAEFDKAFITQTLKHHKKDIQEFEKASKQISDTELKAFIDQTLPKLRQHYQMAQAAARAVGVDESSIAADLSSESDDDATGAAAGAVSGSEFKSQDNSLPDRPRSSLDGATDTDEGGTINQNNATAEADADIAHRQIGADADLQVDADDPSVDVDVEADDGGIFEKGDGKILGLPTDKNDGKFLGIIPNPRADDDDADASVEIEADADVDTDDTSVGSPATSETGTADQDR